LLLLLRHRHRRNVSSASSLSSLSLPRRLTPQTERGLFFARKNEEKSLVARISREGEKTSKKTPVTRAYLHLTLVSLEQKTSANVITLA